MIVLTLSILRDNLLFLTAVNYTAVYRLQTIGWTTAEILSQATQSQSINNYSPSTMQQSHVIISSFSTGQNWIWQLQVHNDYYNDVMVHTYTIYNFRCSLLWLNSHTKAAIDYTPYYSPSLRIFVTRSPQPQTGPSLLIMIQPYDPYRQLWCSFYSAVSFNHDIESPSLCMRSFTSLTKNTLNWLIPLTDSWYVAQYLLSRAILLEDKILCVSLRAHSE